MTYKAWLVDRVRVRAGLPSCRQAEAIIDDILVMISRALPGEVFEEVFRALAESPNGLRPKVPATWRGWSSGLDL